LSNDTVQGIPYEKKRGLASYSEEFGKEISLSILLIPILQDHLVNNFTTDNTPPSEIISTFAIEFFINHGPVASMAPHGNLLLINEINED
jgi:hypothetical protein